MNLKSLYAMIGKENLQIMKTHNMNRFDYSNVYKCIELGQLRDTIISKFGFAIPTEQLVQRLKKLSPIVDMGAGTGFITKLINEAGGQSAAYDLYPPNLVENRYGFNRTFGLVRAGNEDSLKYHPCSTLLLSWPPYNGDFGYKCLTHPKWYGRHVVYIGENDGGCTGDDNLHLELNSKWTLLETIRIPVWHGIHDKAFIYKRKT